MGAFEGLVLGFVYFLCFVGLRGFFLVECILYGGDCGGAFLNHQFAFFLFSFPKSFGVSNTAAFQLESFPVFLRNSGVMKQVIQLCISEVGFISSYS